MTKRTELSLGTAGPPADRVESFLSLIAQHQRRIHHFVRSLVPNPTEADDIIQETNLVLWREFHQFELGSNFAAWSGAIAFHQVLAWRKRRQRERLVFSEEFLTAVSVELRDNSEQHDERTRLLAQCLEQIPAHHRELLRLRYTEGRSIDSIAASLDRTADAVYRMLSRIRHVLFDCTSRSLIEEGRAT